MSNRRKPQLRSRGFSLLQDIGDGLIGQYETAVADLATIPAKPEKGPDSAARRRTAQRKKVAELNAALKDDDHQWRGRVAALPSLRWEALKADFPPREGHDDDTLHGIAVTGYPDVIRACLLEPVLDETQWAERVDTLTSGDCAYLVSLIVDLNDQQGVNVPNLPADWLATPGRSSA